MQKTEPFYEEYTSPDAITKYTRATAGVGISYLLDHDYKKVYLQALSGLPKDVKKRGIRMLEFGCGGGMNLLHLISVLKKEGINVEKAYGSDFSPVLIEAARRESKSYLKDSDLRGLEFHVAKNETLKRDIAASAGISEAKLANSFHFIFGVNTIRYCHAAKQELECSRDIMDLLVPGGVCVNIDMNNRYPFFKSDIKARLNNTKEEECVVPSLEEYGAPFKKAGFEILRQEHFCWIPHSSGPVLSRVFGALTPVLNVVGRSRAMRSLVVARKPEKRS
jgi:SAM-dependent methyltransferase